MKRKEVLIQKKVCKAVVLNLEHNLPTEPLETNVDWIYRLAKRNAFSSQYMEIVYLL